MKTTIVIEDGRVTVQVDDNQPIRVETSPPAKSEQGPAPINSVDQKNKSQHKTARSSTDLSNPLPTGKAAPVCINCGDEMPGAHPRAKYCKKPECKKAQVKAGNDRYRARKGLSVGAGRGRRAAKPVGDWGHEPEAEPLLTASAPEQEPEYLSNCHDAKVRVGGGEDEPGPGGTRYYICLACENACDVHPKPFDDPWNCGACRGHGRLCGLHFNLEAEGKKAPQYVHQL